MSEHSPRRELNKRRSQIQDCLLDLYEYGADNRRPLNGVEIAIFTALVGSAFSLWRGVFLGKTDRDWEKIIEAANKLLLQLVDHNSINYMDEQKTSAWMFGFHVNNAGFRISEVKARFKAAKQSLPAKLANFKLSPVPDTTIQTWKVWDQNYFATNAAIKVLRRMSGKPRASK